MRNFINIVEGIKINENADADNMHGDALSFIKTLSNKGAQEFTDKGRADLPVKANDPRFSDNAMSVEEDDMSMADFDQQDSDFLDGIDEKELDASLDEDFNVNDNDSHLDKLHTMLLGAGLTDLEIRQGVKLGDIGKNKIAGKLGISPEEVDLLVNSLSQELSDADGKTTDALIDDYYNGSINERNLFTSEEKKLEQAFNAGQKCAKKGGKISECPTYSGDNSEEMCDAWKRGFKTGNRSVKESIETRIAKIVNGKDSLTLKISKLQNLALRCMPSSPAQKQVTDTYKKLQAELKPGEMDAHWDKAMGKKKTSESKRPFDKSVMERYSYERDSNGNVTIRDSETGKEKYLQGTQAAKILYKLDHGANEIEVLGPLLMESLVDEPQDGGFKDEIAATAGTYNFPWEYNGKHGFATAFYRTDSETPDLKLQGVRDENGNEMNIDNTMRKELLKQAQEFIGNE